jgi:hypothetical protein
LSDEIDQDDFNGIFDDPLNEKYGGFTTGPAPWEQGTSTDEVYQELVNAMRMAKAIPVPPKLWVVIESLPFYFVRATPIEVAFWVKGLGMPSIIDNFEKWWAAQMIRRGLARSCYLMHESFFEWPADRSPSPPIWHKT